MGESKVPFKTNVDQKIGPFKRLKRNRAADSRKPIKATKVDDAKEKSNRIKWVLRWVLILPLSVYAFVWLVLLLIDLFKT
ncbi:MAG: hypothetical protein OQJ84_04480 [Xanthomonadales bacterium]|nr:hypothetical protein [Xanthomonadales bacterium]